MSLPDWSPGPPSYAEPNSLMLLLSTKTEKLPPNTIQNVLDMSEKFPIKFPTQSVRCKTLQECVQKDTLEKHINSVYPVVHENVLEFYCDFINFKKSYGSSVEKEVYQDMSLKDFVNRLLAKRAVSFVGTYDKYTLITGQKGSGGWESIGTDQEEPPLLLKDCLSYDEIKLAAFLSVSSYTYFVNLGDRKNRSVYSQDRTNIEDEGVIIGMVGPRMIKEYVMDFQEVFISEEQNKVANGYGTSAQPSIHNLFAKFYEDNCWTFDELRTYRKNLQKPLDSRFTDLDDKSVFDNHLYYKRLTFSFDTLLLEANERAKEADKYAYIHVVGLGLGVWRVTKHQEAAYVEALYKRILNLGARLSAVSDICLSYINVSNCGGFGSGEIIPIKNHPLKGIRVHISKRNPNEKLEGPNAGKLLVVSYAWDGNALPGNEFWNGFLGSSGDSSTASSTQVTELHNPHINSLVCSDRLKVVCDKGVIPIALYVAESREKFV